MAITLDWPNSKINVPQSYLTSLGGGLYELDVDELRLDLRAEEATEAGIVWPTTHTHNTEKSLSGVTYSRFVEIDSAYEVDFEDGTYTVKAVGANHNIGDVKTLGDNVSLIIGNSAGLITVTSGSGVLASDITDIADAVWDEAIADHSTAGSVGEALDNVSAGASPSAIADAVWDEDLSTHTTAGTAGKIVNFIKLLILGK